REPLQRRLAVLDDLAQHAERQESALAPFLFEDDLGKRHRGEILTGVVLEDLHFLARFDPATNLLERDVPALARVVQLAVPVALDEPGHQFLAAPIARMTVSYHSSARGYKCPKLTPREAPR